MNRVVLSARIIFPVVIIGMLVAISFLEAPLKFQAPGITIPLGLGIGRLVFAALNVVTGVLLLLLSLSCWAGPAIGRVSTWLLGGMWVVFLLQVVAIRPGLNARTDQVIAGTADPGSIWHYLYIAADVLMLFLLFWFATVQVRKVIPQ